MKSCRDEFGRRIRASGRTAPPGRDLGPMKWGVGKVIFDATYLSEEERNSGVVDSYKEGINNGKLIILPYYHLNMERILPEREDLSVISYIPGKKQQVYCVVFSYFHQFANG